MSVTQPLKVPPPYGDNLHHYNFNTLIESMGSLISVLNDECFRFNFKTSVDFSMVLHKIQNVQPDQYTTRLMARPCISMVLE